MAWCWQNFQYDFLCLNESVATRVHPVAKDPEPSHVRTLHPSNPSPRLVHAIAIH